MSQDLPTIYSIGHSNTSLADFFALLAMHSICLLVDVRSAPYSRYVPHFNKDSLAAEIGSAGLGYVYLGRELGGRPDDVNMYDAEGHAVYARIAQTPEFKRGLENLKRVSADQRVVMMCSEESPVDCHRRLLVGRVLQDEGFRLLHIRGDGRLDAEADLPTPTYARPVQRGFFDVGTAGLEETWRSTQSVLPRKLRENSSDF